MTETAKVYRCENPTCSLGTVKDPGRFTGGAVAEQVLMITGEPEGKCGEGVCPNCCQPGVKEEME